MKIAVTGANGFIGSALIERLIARGHHEVTALVRKGSDLSRLERLKQQGNGFSVKTFSLASREAAAEAIAGADVVHHVAAALRGSPADMVMNTVVATRNLLEAVTARDDPPKVVLVSSFSVYGVAALPRGHVIDERTPIEPLPQRRDLYAQVKIRQEALCWRWRLEHPYPLVVVRPGVVYGPSGSVMSSRVGVRLPGVFLHFGGDNTLPLSYVDNCAEGLAVAGEHPEAVGEVFNALDDELMTAREFLDRYRGEVEPLRALSVPYPLTMLGSKLVAWYHEYSRGQMPDVFTPYKTASIWKGMRFDNRRMKSLGWKQLVPTEEGLRRTFAHLRERR